MSRRASHVDISGKNQEHHDPSALEIDDGIRNLRREIQNNSTPLSLVGDESQDEDTVCRWVALSYGELNKEYHEAYCKEVFRQIRKQLADASHSGGKRRSWF